MTTPTRRRAPLTDYSALELAVAALFFIGGAVLSLSFAVLYVGVNFISSLGAQWRFLWWGE